MQPLVSVIIPCYNHEAYIQESIQSVIDQTYVRIELIVIDDGSKDNSIAKIKEMQQSCKERFERFCFINRENRGLSRTLNQGLQWAQGDYFSVIASDDIMLPEKTQKQLEFFEKDPLTTAVFGAHQYIDQNGQVISVKKAQYREFSFREIFYHQHDIPASSQMIKLKELKNIGGYNENTKVEDWDLWLRLTESGAKLVYIPDVIVGYRMHESNLSGNKALMFDEVYKILNCYKHQVGYAYAEYKVYKLYKIRPARQESEMKYWALRIKYLSVYLSKLIFRF